MIKILTFKYWLQPLLGFMLAALAAQSTPTETEIRVAIIEKASEVMIGGADLKVSISGQKWKSASSLKVKSRGKNIVVDGKKTKGPVRIRSGKDLIKVNNNSYRGEIVIYADAGGLLVVDELPLEMYLVGLINAEVYSSWPRETIRAQAVVARTYGLHRAERNKSKLFDLRSTVLDQCYRGSALEDSASADAVNSTRGEVLFYGGNMAETFYHSTCGGTTAGVKEVWGNEVAYLQSVKCNWCVESPRYFWSYEADGAELGKALQKAGFNLGSIRKIRIAGKTPSGRNSMVDVQGSKGSKSIKATDFRRAIGYTNIFSARFDSFEPESGRYKFLGRGSGHGVGMCQWGARGLAIDKKTYRDILLYYYRGCSIVQVY